MIVSAQTVSCHPAFEIEIFIDKNTAGLQCYTILIHQNDLFSCKKTTRVLINRICVKPGCIITK